MERKKLLGNIMIKCGFCSKAHIKFVEEAKMLGDDRKMGEILLDLEIITPMQLSIALAKQRTIIREQFSRNYPCCSLKKYPSCSVSSPHHEDF